MKPSYKSYQNNLLDDVSTIYQILGVLREVAVCNKGILLLLLLVVEGNHNREIGTQCFVQLKANYILKIK
jgi:hypothetical protein